MKYSAVILSLALSAFAMPQEQASTITESAAAPSHSFTPQELCSQKCDDSDVTCKAECFGVARPNESQVNETTKCAMECDQGSGSPEDTEAYAKCQADCFARLFPSSQTLQAPGGQASDAPSGTANPDGTAAPTGTDAEATGSPSEGEGEGEGEATGSPSTAEPSGAASANTVKLAGVGLAGLALAVFGL
ncbi:hypothetical protein M011DRAFT_464417 [Sporormia fimetaria CBS 119925]|uniref:Extracellular membrane protein CFEM domain-containing protein n=1 Tax=Sporormia fimetaria CBS 119925 TaxID=1340428 RepID=A0A6A6VKG1_9PLEO|nr:hypothetical protein M011DRAFT_464417 [Sporormia fimetaria CBS 119925]